jgi:hypothetical protein
MEEIDHFGQRITSGDDLTEVEAEELAGYALQSGHEQETLRPDEIGRRLSSQPWGCVGTSFGTMKTRSI